MAHILKNKHLEIHVDAPLEKYCFSRFDWTGKITTVKFQDIVLSSVERTDDIDPDHFGKGFYNEFGFDTPLGFAEAEIGGWFHKIGVGLLKKQDATYKFDKAYEIDPAEFDVIPGSNSISMTCTSKAVNGYSYVLTKTIALHESGFSISYALENTGEKDLVTDEYTHNFTTIANDRIGPGYLLKFPFPIRPELFDENVNPEGKVDIGKSTIGFHGRPEVPFFFSYLSGNEYVPASWELVNHQSGIGIRETGNFETCKVNVWGWKHVISPELFFNISLKPGESAEWSRHYTVFRVDRRAP